MWPGGRGRRQRRGGGGERRAAKLPRAPADGGRIHACARRPLHAVCDRGGCSLVARVCISCPMCRRRVHFGPPTCCGCSLASTSLPPPGATAAAGHALQHLAAISPKPKSPATAPCRSPSVSPRSPEQEGSGAAPEEAFEAYCRDVELTAAWGGQPELQALSHALKAHILVHSTGMPVLEVGEEFKGGWWPVWVVQVDRESARWPCSCSLPRLVPAQPLPPVATSPTPARAARCGVQAAAARCGCATCGMRTAWASTTTACSRALRWMMRVRRRRRVLVSRQTNQRLAARFGAFAMTSQPALPLQHPRHAVFCVDLPGIQRTSSAALMVLAQRTNSSQLDIYRLFFTSC